MISVLVASVLHISQPICSGMIVSEMFISIISAIYFDEVITPSHIFFLAGNNSRARSIEMAFAGVVYYWISFFNQNGGFHARG